MRRVIAAVLAAGLLLSTQAFAGGARSGDRGRRAAAMFRGDARHTGWYQDESGVAEGHLKWRFRTGGQIVSSPALWGGLLYIGSGDGFLYALEAGTGALRWRFKTGGAVDSSPAVTEGTVFCVSRDGSCYAVDAEKGTLKWRFRTAGEKRFGAKGLFGIKPERQYLDDPWDFYLSSPVLSRGNLYFGCGDGCVYALERETGKLLWRFRTEGVVHSSPAVWRGTVYVGSWDRYLYAIDARSGRERWRAKTDVEGTVFVGIQSSPAVGEGTVYFGCRDAKLHAVDAGTGKEKWATPMAGRSWVVGSPAVVGDRIYFGTSDSALFMALDADTGEKKLELPLGMFVFSSPAVAADTAYIGSMNGRLYAIDLKRGEARWFFETEASAKNAQGARRAEGTKSEDLFTEATWTAEKFPRAVERVLSLGSILASPVPAGGNVYFGSADGYVYCVS